MNKQELIEFGKLVLDTFHSEGKTKSGKPRLARAKYDEWVNEKLQKELKMNKEKYFTIMKNYKTAISGLVANICSYEKWSDDFCRNEIKEHYAQLIKNFNQCDFTQFTMDELKQLDFKMWDENTILMPVWAIDCLKDGTVLTTISGNEITFDKSKGLDKDERFGCTAYGFSKSQLRDVAVNTILSE